MECVRCGREMKQTGTDMWECEACGAGAVRTGWGSFSNPPSHINTRCVLLPLDSPDPLSAWRDAIDGLDMTGVDMDENPDDKHFP